MATTPKKTKTKRRPTSRAKSKRRNAPLLTASASVRKATSVDTAPSDILSNLPNPAVTLFNSMARVTAAYVELTSRLAQCRSPMDLWREQMRFGQRLFGELAMVPRHQSEKTPQTLPKLKT